MLTRWLKPTSTIKLWRVKPPVVKKPQRDVFCCYPDWFTGSTLVTSKYENYVGIWQNYEPFSSGGKAVIHMGEVENKISFKYDFDLRRNMWGLGFLIVTMVQLWCPCNYETELINIASDCLAIQLKPKMFWIEPKNDFPYV